MSEPEPYVSPREHAEDYEAEQLLEQMAAAPSNYVHALLARNGHSMAELLTPPDGPCNPADLEIVEEDE